MGFFDSLSPTLSWIDSTVLGVMPAWLRLLVWSAISALVSMWLYRLTSNQKRIGELKAELQRAQKALADYDEDDFSGLLPLMRQSLGLSMRRLGRTLGPALLASFPLIFVLAWASNTYSRVIPEPGAQIAVELIGTQPMAAAENQVDWQDIVVRGKADNLSLLWPSRESGAAIRLDNLELLRLPLEQPAPIVHRKKWWNSLIGNPAGYLPDQDTIDAIKLHLPEQEFIPFGPGWARGWLCFFFVGVLIFSLVVKAALRIH